MVLTLLASDRQLERVTAAAPAPHRVLRASSVTAIRALLRAQPADVLVLDPAAGSHVPGGSPSVADFVALGTEHPYIPVVFYVSNAATAIRVIARCPSRERCEAVVVGIGDEGRELAQAMERLVNGSLVSQVLRPLAARLNDAPPAMVRGVRDAFTTPRLFRTAADLAAAAYMSRRSLDRWLTRRRLVPAAELLRLARAFLAVRLDRDMLLGRRELNMSCGLSETLETAGYVTRVAGEAHSRLVGLDDPDLVRDFSRMLHRAPDDAPDGAWSDAPAPTADRRLRRRSRRQ